MSQTRQLSSGVTTRFLIITARGHHWISILRNSVAHVELVSEPQATEDILSANQFDIILYDDTTFDAPTESIINEIHLQNPNALIAIITDNPTDDYHDSLIDAGAWDTLLTIVPDNIMVQRINAIVRQSARNQKVAYRTRRLHAINLLTQKLHDASHPKLMMVDAIELICNYFDVYAVAITIRTDETYQVFAGTYEDRRRIYETKVEMRSENPLRQVIESNISLIFPDVKKHPYYRSIPVIKYPESSVIIPIKHGTKILGSMAFFGQGQPYTTRDVPVFELLSSNFGSAYHNVREQHQREIEVQSMSYLLNAWPELNATSSREKVVHIVHEHLQGIESVKAAGIWLFEQLDVASVTYSEFPPLHDRLAKLYEAGEVSTISAQFTEGLVTQQYWRGENQLNILTPLFEMMNSNQLSLIPISSNGFEGVMIIASQGTHLSTADLAIIENLAQVTASVLERNTLIESLQNQQAKLKEQTGRVEGVLRSIDEGIFFVDDNHRVVYSNPQFSELTKIYPSQMMDLPAKTVFDLLSKISPDQQQVYEQLNQAATQVEAQEVDDTYPFVEIRTLNDDNLIVEFMRVDADHEQRGWIGVIGKQDATRTPSIPQENTLLHHIVEDMTIPIMALSTATLNLTQQYDMLPPSNFEGVIDTLVTDAGQVQSLWGNFIQIYKGEVEGVPLEYKTVEPSNFIEKVLNHRRMEIYQRQIGFEHNATDVEIRIDERQMRQSFINLVEFLLSLTNQGAPIFVEVDTEGTQIVITLQEKTASLPSHVLEDIFNPQRSTDKQDMLYQHRLSLYAARQIIIAHGGQINITNIRGSGLVVRIALPLVGEEDTYLPLPTQTEDHQYKANHEGSSYHHTDRGMTITVVESRSQFTKTVYPQMEVEGHTIIKEERIDGALFDLKMTKVDLVILEADEYTRDIIGQVKKIRSEYEVPIALIARETFKQDCLAALGEGADDYYLIPDQPTSENPLEKLLAQLQATAKRLDLAARIAKPVHVGNLEIDFSRRRVHLGDKLIDLTAKEYEILRVLVMNEGQVISHKQLLTKVWGPEHDNETQYLWVNISRLRRKLEPTKESPRYIQNEPRVGYVFTTDV